MGSESELCATFYPDRQTGASLARSLSEFLDVATPADHAYSGLAPSYAEKCSFEPLRVVIGADGNRVFVTGLTYKPKERALWEHALTAFPAGGGTLGVIATQEAGYFGEGRLYQWAEATQQFEQMAEYEELDEGFYGNAVVQWFEQEHGRKPGSYRQQALEECATILDAFRDPT